jgi:hypothetical protein
VDVEDIPQLLQSHAEELSNKDLVALWERREEEAQQTPEVLPKPSLAMKAVVEFFYHIRGAMNIIQTMLNHSLEG